MPNEYYGVSSTPTEDFLAHYGVRGMKWGVRKAIAQRNGRKLSRQFRKAEKKLAKLEKRAANGKKYAKRAALMGAGAAAAGGLAVAGTGGVSSAMAKIGAHGGQAMIKGGKALNRAGSAVSRALYKTGNSTLRKIGAHGGQAMIKAGNAMKNAAGGVSSGMYGASKAVRKWGASNSVGKALGGQASKVSDKYLRNARSAAAKGKAYGLGGLSNNTIARIGAGAVGVGLAAGAARNAYKAATTKKAAAKAAAFKKEMQSAFKGTQYENQVGTTSKKKKRR